MSFFEAGLFIPPAHLVVAASLCAVALICNLTALALLVVRFWRGE